MKQGYSFSQTHTYYILAIVLITISAAVQVNAQGTQVTIPAGTTLLIKMDQGVSSEQKPGTKFGGTLEADVMAGNVSAIKTGTAVFGVVKDAKGARRAAGKAKVVIELTHVRIDGQLMPIVTEPVGEEGKGSGRKTARGAATGAAIGAAAGGGDGAAKGAAIGATASTLKKGEQAGTASGELLEFRLMAPLTLQAQAQTTK